MGKLYEKFKYKILIGIIILLLSIILSYYIYIYMITDINVIETFYFESTQETYDRIAALGIEYDIDNKNNENKERYELLKTDYKEYINESDSVEKSECLKKN